eukprot:scpid66478/ scgid10494/ 
MDGRGGLEVETEFPGRHPFGSGFNQSMEPSADYLNRQSQHNNVRDLCSSCGCWKRRVTPRSKEHVEDKIDGAPLKEPNSGAMDGKSMQDATRTSTATARSYWETTAASAMFKRVAVFMSVLAACGVLRILSVIVVAGCAGAFGGMTEAFAQSRDVWRNATGEVDARCEHLFLEHARQMQSQWQAHMLQYMQQQWNLQQELHASCNKQITELQDEWLQRMEFLTTDRNREDHGIVVEPSNATKVNSSSPIEHVNTEMNATAKNEGTSSNTLYAVLILVGPAILIVAVCVTIAPVSLLVLHVFPACSMDMQYGESVIEQESTGLQRLLDNAVPSDDESEDSDQEPSRKPSKVVVPFLERFKIGFRPNKDTKEEKGLKVN